MQVRFTLAIAGAVLHVVVGTDPRTLGVDRAAPAVQFATFGGEFDVPAILIDEDLNIFVQQEPADFVVITVKVTLPVVCPAGITI